MMWCDRHSRYPARHNPFLTGIFAPVSKEITAVNLPVIGTLPSCLNGEFVRNGPNPALPPVGGYHW